MSYFRAANDPISFGCDFFQLWDSMDVMSYFTSPLEVCEPARHNEQIDVHLLKQKRAAEANIRLPQIVKYM